MVTFAQLLVVAVNGWHVGSGYAPPTHHGIPQSELLFSTVGLVLLKGGPDSEMDSRY